MARIRQPIVCVLGHVDVGKTLLLDKIRGTAVQMREAGGLTQHIGASFFPAETLLEICREIFKAYRAEVKIPGLLVIDTPGHEAFANLRRRGGSAADIAILVVDVNRGFETQTYECIEILKERRTPFLVAANKLDLVPGWVSHPDQPFFKSYKEQSEDARRELDTRMYDIIGTLSQLGFRADRYDRVRDFMRTVAIVPVSAKTGEGIPDLIAVLVGLTQQYLTERLRTTEGPAKGTVLEVKEEIGLGTTLNAIIYDGVLRKGDTIVVGGKEKPIVTRVKALLLPQPLDEMRDPRKRFIQVEEVTAAAGVKIVAPGLEDALAGSPVVVVPEGGDVDEVVRNVVEEVESVKVSTDKVGVIVKADTLGSLEAIVAGLRRRGIPVRMGDIGDVSKRDVVEAATVGLKEPLYGVILAFNVKVLPDAEEEAYERGVRIFSDRIIYNLMDGYVKWLESKRTERERREFESLVKPGKIRVLPGYVFRRAKPAIFGVEVLSGRIKPRYELVRKDGKNLGRISQIQEMGKPISEATAGMQVAISMPKPVVGRHVREGDVLYVRVPEAHARRLLEKFSHMLSEDELETLKEYLRMLKEEKMERLGM